MAASRFLSFFELQVTRRQESVGGLVGGRRTRHVGGWDDLLEDRAKIRCKLENQITFGRTHTPTASTHKHTHTQNL